MSTTAVGRRYGRALFDLAKANGAVEEVGQSLSDFVAGWEESPDLQSLFGNPSYRADTRIAVLKEMANAMFLSDFVLKSLCLLSDRGRMAHIPEIYQAYRDLAEADSGRVRAEVITASDLPDSYFEELEATIARITGREVTLTRRTDPSLIGGVVTRIGDQVFDGSIKHHLTELKAELLS